jgi:hypothetical protein
LVHHLQQVASQFNSKNSWQILNAKKKKKLHGCVTLPQILKKGQLVGNPFFIFPNIFMLPKNLREHSVADVSVRLSIHPSSYFLNFVSEIDVVDNMCSLRQGHVDQGISRSFWKVQGYSGHIKESNFNISLHKKFTFHRN